MPSSLPKMQEPMNDGGLSVSEGGHPAFYRMVRFQFSYQSSNTIHTQVGIVLHVVLLCKNPQTIPKAVSLSPSPHPRFALPGLLSRVTCWTADVCNDPITGQSGLVSFMANCY